MMFMYSILDGFDLGMGVLVRLVAKNDGEKRAMLTSIAPFWDGNEVWLVIAATAIFVFYPPIYSVLLPSFYLLFTVTIIVFMLRAISLEFTYAEENLSTTWLSVFSLTSFLASFFGILFLGVIVSGVSAGADGVLQLQAKDVLRLPPITFTLAWLTLLLLHSISYLAGKTEGDLRGRLLKHGRNLWIAFMVLFLATVASFAVQRPDTVRRPAVLIGIAIAIVGSVLYRIAIRHGASLLMFGASAIGMAGLWVFVAGSIFPSVASYATSGNATMTIYNSSAPLGTLRFVVPFSIVGMAVVMAYALFSYGVLRSRNSDKAG
jgi:cytochrome d ubiquinol oxidase subunit II